MSIDLKKPNRTCKNCGQRYYACSSCERTNGWKLVCCSPSCYNSYIDKVLESRKPKQLTKDDLN